MRPHNQILSHLLSQFVIAVGSPPLGASIVNRTSTVTHIPYLLNSLVPGSEVPNEAQVAPKVPLNIPNIRPPALCGDEETNAETQGLFTD